jgi:hypothetical protein
MIDYVMADTEHERAGFLLGNLCQDPDTNLLFVTAQAQIEADLPAPAAPVDCSSMTHFTFPPEMFSDLHRVIGLRKKNEIVVGWYHSHPWPFSCKFRDKCACTSIFFSAADVEVMEAAFAAPYQLAVVVGRATLENNQATAHMYGWKDGFMAAREFQKF